MREKRPMTENLGTFQNLGAESVAGGVRSGCEEQGAPGPSQAPCVMGSDVVIFLAPLSLPLQENLVPPGPGIPGT